mgnify:CR=1 FL=1
MKELYSFDVKRQIVKEVPYMKKTKDGEEVEAIKKSKKTIKNRVVFAKPNISAIEDAEFFYGQKFNEYINAGFLTKAMLAKKMGDNGGLNSEVASDRMADIVKKNMAASKVIEFFAGAKDLTEEQKQQLQEAEEDFIATQAEVHEYEVALASQFNQTADAKAEQKLIEWLVLKFSFYEEEAEDKKKLFPLFEGESYETKRNSMIMLQELEDEDIEDAVLHKLKAVFDKSFDTLIRVVSIWYNKLGTDQESIDKVLKDLFNESADKEEEK